MDAADQLSWSSPWAVMPSKVHSVRQFTVNRFGLIGKANWLRQRPSACRSRPSSSVMSRWTRTGEARGGVAVHDVPAGRGEPGPLAVADHVAVDADAPVSGPGVAAVVHGDGVEPVGGGGGGVGVPAVAWRRACCRRTGTVAPTSGLGTRSCRPRTARRRASSCPCSDRVGRGASCPGGSDGPRRRTPARCAGRRRRDRGSVSS